MGAPALNRALSAFVREYAFKPAPYPNSLDLLRHIRREAGPAHQELITDLFEKITLVDAKALEPKAVQRPDGRWDVSFTVQARKLHANSKGVETESPLQEPFDIGVFTAEPGKKGFSSTSVLLMERRMVRSGSQEVKITVERKPSFVGVDPYNKRIDRNSDDNLVRIPE